ncbi:hypothetical protein NDU88_007175 [Pleurodeles waltl]|uniref:Uncharacterized protein n=1 Tax=Pleurodeles waltl TaxID=8319 RepID=A0AAV7QN85_PLEWA|nr:hypothetical protein NDU88_007175 [Pleurodeles waltl]
MMVDPLANQVSVSGNVVLDGEDMPLGRKLVTLITDFLVLSQYGINGGGEQQYDDKTGPRHYLPDSIFSVAVLQTGKYSYQEKSPFLQKI